MISRDQVINRLREAHFTFNRKTDRVEMWKRKGSSLYVPVSLKSQLPELYVGQLLTQAGLSREEIQGFLKACVR